MGKKDQECMAIVPPSTVTLLTVWSFKGEAERLRDQLLS